MTAPTLELSRAQRLKECTRDTHQRLDTSIITAASFDTVEAYARFAVVQYLFHRDIEALYQDKNLQALLPGLAQRCRLGLIAADLADLGQSLPQTDQAPAFPAGEAADVATALGWLYVAEGSNMGAALLRKEAVKIGLSDTHGARHLAPPPEGPAAHWRTFTAALNGVDLSAIQETHVVAGANAAFARVQALVDARIG